MLRQAQHDKSLVGTDLQVCPEAWGLEVRTRCFDKLSMTGGEGLSMTVSLVGTDLQVCPEAWDLEVRTRCFDKLSMTGGEGLSMMLGQAGRGDQTVAATM